jgi:hypothetical protein
MRYAFRKHEAAFADWFGVVLLDVRRVNPLFQCALPRKAAIPPSLSSMNICFVSS